jgi:MFS family permease
LVDVRLAVAPGILGANLAALLIGCSVFAGAAAGIILTQQTPSGGVGLGHNVAITGLLMGPMALGSLAGPPIARRLVRRLGERSVLPIGTLSCALGFGIFARWHHTELEVLLMMGLMGLGVGITYSILPSLVVARVPMQRTASATGVNQVLRLLGGAVGSAGLAAVLAAHVDGASGLPAESGYVMASLLAAGVSLVAAPLSYWLVPDAPAGASEAGGERTAYLPEEPVTP